MTFTAGTPSIPFPPLSLEQHLQKALESLTQAYKGLEEKEKKEKVKQLEDYTQSILVGENPFIQGKEKANDVLKGLVEEVRALYKEVAPTKETYVERLKRDLLSSSSPPSLSLQSPTPSHSSKSSTSTRSKKKQLQERKLVLITDEKDQPLDTFSIQNKVNQLFASKLQVEKPVLASRARTKGKQNILLTTTEEYN